MVELSKLQLRADPGLGRGLSSDDIDRPTEGGPPIQRRVRAVNDLYRIGMIDGEVDHPCTVPRVGLRYAVDEQQGALELVSLPRHPPQLDGLERAGLGGVHEAGRALQRIHELEITPRIDLLTFDHGNQGRNVVRAPGGLGRGDDESFNNQRPTLHGNGDARLGIEGNRDRLSVNGLIAQRRDLKLASARSQVRDPEPPTCVGRRRTVGPRNDNEGLSDGL
jgi:hypothetical protein